MASRIAYALWVLAVQRFGMLTKPSLAALRAVTELTSTVVARLLTGALGSHGSKVTLFVLGVLVSASFTSACDAVGVRRGSAVLATLRVVLAEKVQRSPILCRMMALTTPLVMRL